MKITTHGIKWINNNEELFCPECHDPVSSWKIRADKQWAQLNSIYTVECRCSLCGCEWKISRSERMQ
jgi:hypothetical protein